jgi:hypothetical protein
LQEQRGTDGADERDQGRGVPEWPVGDPFNEQSQAVETTMAMMIMITTDTIDNSGLALSMPNSAA